MGFSHSVARHRYRPPLASAATFARKSRGPVIAGRQTCAKSLAPLLASIIICNGVAKFSGYAKRSRLSVTSIPSFEQVWVAPRTVTIGSGISKLPASTQRYQRQQRLYLSPARHGAGRLCQSQHRNGATPDGKLWVPAVRMGCVRVTSTRCRCATCNGSAITVTIFAGVCTRVRAGNGRVSCGESANCSTADSGGCHESDDAVRVSSPCRSVLVGTRAPSPTPSSGSEVPDTPCLSVCLTSWKSVQFSPRHQ